MIHNKMRLRLGLTLVVVICSLSSLGFAAFAQGGLQKEFEAIYAKRDEAIKSKRFEFLKAQETTDYSEKGSDGAVRDREQADAMFDQMVPMIKEVTEQATKIQSVREADGGVVVESSDHAKVTIEGPDGKSHELTERSRSRDLWVKSGGAWKIKHHEELEGTMEMDGTPIKTGV